MNMLEALEWAADYAERNKLFALPVNLNGYPVDSKTLTPAERVAIITDLARAACGSNEPEVTRVNDKLARQIAAAINYAMQRYSSEDILVPFDSPLAVRIRQYLQGEFGWSEDD